MGFRVARGLQHSISMNNNNNKKTGTIKDRLESEYHITRTRDGYYYGHDLCECSEPEEDCDAEETYLGRETSAARKDLDEVHVTSVRGRGVYGHETCHCDAAGCAGDTLYLGLLEEFGCDSEDELRQASEYL